MFTFVLMFFFAWFYKYALNNTLKYKRHAFI